MYIVQQLIYQYFYTLLLSLRKVLVLEDPQGSIYKSLSFCIQSIMYGHVKSINSVTATVHEDTVKNVLLTDVRYYLLLYASK